MDWKNQLGNSHRRLIYVTMCHDVRIYTIGEKNSPNIVFWPPHHSLSTSRHTHTHTGWRDKCHLKDESLRQEDCQECKASLGSSVNSKPSWAAEWNPVLRKPRVKQECNNHRLIITLRVPHLCCTKFSQQGREHPPKGEQKRIVMPVESKKLPRIKVCDWWHLASHTSQNHTSYPLTTSLTWHRTHPRYSGFREAQGYPTRSWGMNSNVCVW